MKEQVQNGDVLSKRHFTENRIESFSGKRLGGRGWCPTGSPITGQDWVRPVYTEHDCVQLTISDVLWVSLFH